MEAIEASGCSSSLTFLLRFGRSGGSGRGRSPSGSAPPVWWGCWSAPDTGDSWRSAAPTCAASSPANAEAQVRKSSEGCFLLRLLFCAYLFKLQILDWLALAQPCVSRFIPENNNMKTNTGILDRMLWIPIKRPACQRNPVKVCEINYVSEAENRENNPPPELTVTRVDHIPTEL